MALRPVLLFFCSCAVVCLVSAQAAADADFQAAERAWGRADFATVIEGTTRVLNKPGIARSPNYAEARYMRGAAYCRTEPATSSTRSEGRKQLTALISDLEMEIQLAPLAGDNPADASRVARKAAIEQTKCTSVADVTPADKSSFESLGIRYRPVSRGTGTGGGGGGAGTGGTAVVSGAADTAAPGPGTGGRLRETDLLLKKEVLDLQIQQLQTDQKLHRLQGGIPAGGGLSR